MTKWEYRRDMPSIDYNDLGAEGWELCGFTPTGMAVFKRPLSASFEETADERVEGMARLRDAVNAARLP